MKVKDEVEIVIARRVHDQQTMGSLFLALVASHPAERNATAQTSTPK